MSFKSILKYFLIWQILVIFVVSSLASNLPLRPSDIFLGGGITAYLRDPVLNFRANFDGMHYSLIATHGYNFGQQAFFPFYPRLISFFKSINNNPVFVGSLISLTAFFLALFILSRLIALDYSSRVVKWTIIALLLFPTSFFFSAVYTESLFFLLVVSSFYFARTGRPWLSCILGALAANTRLVGIFLLPALLLEFIIQSRGQPWLFRIRKLIPLLIIPLGLLVYMYYLKSTTGDPLIFYTLQSSFKQGRDTAIILPYQVLWRYLKMIFTVNRADPLYLTVWLEFITGIIFVTLAIISLIRQRLSYAVFNLLAFMLPTLTGVFTSLPRFILVCFPVFILIGELLADRKILRRVTLLAFGLSGVLFLSLFARGYWVA